MNDTVLIDAYMNTHIRMNGNTQPESWTDEQRYCAFAILPAPGVSFEEFKSKLNVKTAPSIDDLTEDEKIDLNTEELEKSKIIYPETEAV